MSKLFYTLLCLSYSLAPIRAQESWVNLDIYTTNSSANESNSIIAFDDFPDDSIPDLGYLLGEPSIDTADCFKAAAKAPSSEKEDENDEIGTDIYAFPSAMVNGCVNIINGEFQESQTDFSIPGAVPFNLQRYYSGSGCKKHSLLYGWQLNHGAKLLTYDDDHELFFKKAAIIKGGDRHGVRFNKIMESVFKDFMSEQCFCCLPSFFKNNVTNCSLGEIKAQTNFKNDRIYEGNLSYCLVNADGSRSLFERSSHDPERESKTHGYRLEKLELPDGGSYKYTYSQSFGMPVSINQFDRKGDKVAGLQLTKDLNLYQFKDNPELTYISTTNEKITYRFMLYGSSSDTRAVLNEVIPPHSPKVKYSYETVNDHYKQKRLCKRELPANRTLKIIYNDEGRVQKLLSPAGKDNEIIATHTFSYFKNVDGHIGTVKNGLGGTKNYRWDRKRKRLIGILTYDENDRIILKEHYRWGDQENDQSHLSARIFEKGNGELISYQEYNYDSYGNVTCLSLYGNLTGKNNSPVFLVHGLSKCDVLQKIFKYDAKHRRISEDDGRILNRFSYLEETNLLAAHYITYDGRIQIRHAYQYDASGAVCGKISDDGSAENIDDLTDVSERKMQTIKNSVTGLPEIIEEYTLFPTSSSEKKQLIRKTVNAYDMHGWLITQSIYDSNKKRMYTLEWQYDSHGNVIYEKNALSDVTISQYDENDNLVYEQKTDIAPRFMTYDFMNRLIKDEQKSPHGDSLIKTYSYDVMGNCVSSTDIYGKTTLHEYDVQGRLRKTTHPSFNNTDSTPCIQYTHNALGHAASTTDGNGNTISTEYNPNGKLIFKVYPDGTSKKNCYTLWGELAESIARDGSKTQYTYDPQGREIKKEWFDSTGTSAKTTTKTYNAFHLIAETDGKGTKTNYTYDAAGRLASKKVQNRTTTYSYDSLGRETKVSNSLDDGTFISYVKLYDVLDRVIESYTQSPNGEITKKIVKRYDGQSNEIKSQDWNQAGKAVTTTKYDSFSRVICVTNPLGESTHIAYDLDRLRKEVTDPLGVKRVTTYNPFGDSLLEQCYDPMGQLVEQIAYRYDLNGNKILRSITTDNQPVETIWRYDSLNQLTHTIEAVKTPDQKSVQYKYNKAGCLTTLIKNDGTSLDYTYDTLGRKTSLKSSDGTVSYIYTYDKNDNLLSAKDKINGTTINRTYDKYDQLISDILPHGHKLNYTYDSLGNVKQIVLPDATKIDYTYQGNTLHLITRTGTLSYSHTYISYDPSSNPTRMRRAEEAGELEINYDLLSRSTMIKSSQWQENQSYEAHLLKQRASEDNFGKTVSCYTYDSRDQILSENGTAKHTFEYDWQGNHISHNGHSRKFSACNALLKVKGCKHTYDLNGNRTSDASNNYKYDAIDRLIEVKTPSGKYQYTYDALGRRVSKTHSDKTTYYLWQKQQEIGTLSAKGAIQELQVLNPSNQAIAFELQGTLYVPQHDALGHVRALLDSAGNCVSTYRYSAFGEEKVLGNVLTPWRYSGKRIDPETGLIYFGKRYYAPKTLCWLTPDPIGDGDGPNYYAYVHNNPLLYNDPDGRLAWLLAAPFVIEFFTITWGGAAVALEVTCAVVTMETLAATVVAAGIAVGVHEGVKALDAAVNTNSNPFNGPVDEDVMIGDSSGNIIPVPGGHQLGGSKDGKCIQQKDKDGKPTGLRKDGRGHPPSPVHQDPRSQKPHGHVPGVTNPDGTPWLPIH